MKQRHFLTAALVLSALAAAGCTDAAFTSLNAGFKEAKALTSNGKNTVMPVAALATSLGTVQILNVIAATSNQSIIAAGGGNIIAAGGGNIIAAGGGNLANPVAGGGASLMPRFSLMSTTETHTQHIDKAKTVLDITYTSTIDGKNAETVISSCKGTTNGYSMDATGSFSYKGGEVNHVDCSLTGTVDYQTLHMRIKKLNFKTTDPLPTRNAELGSFRFEQVDGDAFIEASVKYNDAGKLAVNGNYQAPGSGTPTPISYDEDQPTADEQAAAKVGG